MVSAEGFGEKEKKYYWIYHEDEEEITVGNYTYYTNLEHTPGELVEHIEGKDPVVRCIILNEEFDLTHLDDEVDPNCLSKCQSPDCSTDARFNSLIFASKLGVITNQFLTIMCFYFRWSWGSAGSQHSL